MKRAIFGDVHANLEALQSFLDHSRANGVDEYVFLGDIVGYGPNPDECVDLLRTIPNLVSVVGNHDAAVVWQTSPYSMNSYAQKSILWTMDQLKEENLEYLRGLTPCVVEEDVCFCHSSPAHSDDWPYLSTKVKAFWAFLFTPYQLSFVSHTHTPQVIAKEGHLNISMTGVSSGETVELAGSKRWIVNCGSAGQPRDGQPSGSYCIYDDSQQSVIFERFHYDYELTGRKIVEAGLPEFLGRRLMSGR